MILVLVHGWGFDAGFWRPLQAALPEFETVALDLGFTGRPRLEIPDGPAVAVGHSLGFAWALRQRRAWAGLVSINGFARFTRDADFPHGTPPRVLERMRTRFAEAPDVVWREFMGRVGAGSPVTPAEAGVQGQPGQAGAPALDARLRGHDENSMLGLGLSWLAEWDERAALAAHRGPLLALAAEDDPLVPEAMARQTFPELRLRPDGGHVLPLTRTEWCAAAIRAFLP